MGKKDGKYLGPLGAVDKALLLGCDVIDDEGSASWVHQCLLVHEAHIVGDGTVQAKDLNEASGGRVA